MILKYVLMIILLILRIMTGLFFLLVAMSAQFYNGAFADSAQDSTVIAALAVNLARFTEWPSESLKTSDTTIQLCTLGDNVIQQAFAEVDNKQVGTRSLKVINLSRLTSIENCHVLYISRLDRNTTAQLLAEVAKRPILTIGGDNRYFLKDGGMVALTIVGSNVSLQINLGAVKQAGLQISSRVLKLATIVNP